MFKRIFITYTKQNPDNNEIYSGRASGEDTGSLIILLAIFLGYQIL